MNYTETKMFKEIFEQPTILESLRAKLTPELDKIKSAYKKLKPNSIITASRGSSSNACQYFKYCAEVYLGLPVSPIYPSVYTMYNGSLKLDKKLCIGVSQSGKAADAIKVLEEGKKHKSITVAVTNNPDSPMAKMADYHLFLDTGLEESVAATKTFTAQMYALMLLVESLSGKKIETSSIAAGVKKVLASEKSASAIADKLVSLKDAFVIGRGFNFPSSLECALKMQETTYTKAKAFAASDFHHGPFAMTDSNTTMFLLMPKGSSLKDLKELKEKAELAGAKTIVFSDDSSIKGTIASLVIPSGTDAETAFYTVVAVQLLVNALSIKKGINPDQPRGLNKITITL